MRSLKSKLILSHFVVILCAFLLTAAVAIIPVRRAQERELDARLQQSAEIVARQVDLARMTSDELLVGDRLGPAGLVRLIGRNQTRIAGTLILLVNEQGEVVFDSRPGQPLAGMQSDELRQAVESVASRIDPLTGAEHPLVRLSEIQQVVTSQPTTIEGLRVVVAGTPATPAGDTEPLYVAAVAPERDVPIVGRIVQPIIIGSLVGLLVSVLIAIVISRSISRPLNELTATAREIDAGNLDLRARASSDAEVGTLVHAFNGMLDRLASTYVAQRRLLAHIAHELRTPLTSIQGYAGAVRDGVAAEGPARDEALSIIVEESERMNALVNQILQLTRLESGELPMRRETIAVAELFETVAREYHRQASDKGVSLEIAVNEELTIQGDPEYLRQALSNLVANAVRHTPEGGSIMLSASHSTASTVRLQVSDTGEGISNDDMAHIFERFYRGAGDGRRRFGLGLAIVREIVDRHAGTISVESTPGVGTIFTIELPVG